MCSVLVSRSFDGEQEFAGGLPTADTTTDNVKNNCSIIITAHTIIPKFPTDKIIANFLTLRKTQNNCKESKLYLIRYFFFVLKINAFLYNTYYLT